MGEDARPVWKSLILISVLLLPILAEGATVYLTPSAALKLMFKDSQEIVSEKKRLDSSRRQTIEKQLGYQLGKDEWTFFVAKTDGRVDGYALMDHELGKVEPITFMVGLNPDGTIRALEVLVYRESHGGEIRESHFKKQFVNKTLEDPLILKKDIKNISGATVSSRAMTVGAKRVLALWNVFYGQ